MHIAFQALNIGQNRINNADRRKRTEIMNRILYTMDAGYRSYSDAVSLFQGGRFGSFLFRHWLSFHHELLISWYLESGDQHSYQLALLRELHSGGKPPLLSCTLLSCNLQAGFVCDFAIKLNTEHLYIQTQDINTGRSRASGKLDSLSIQKWFLPKIKPTHIILHTQPI